MPANVTQTGQKDDLMHICAELGKEGTVGRQRIPDMPNVRQRMHDDSGNGDWLTGRPLALQGFGGIQEAHYRYPRAGPSFLRGAEKLKGRNPEPVTTGSTWPSTAGRAHLRLFHLLSLAPHHGLRRLGQWNLSRTWPAVPAIGCQRANKTFQNVIGNSDPRAVPALAGGGGCGPTRYADTFPFFQHLDLEGKSSPQEESLWFATTSTKGRRPLVFQRLSTPPASTRGDDAMKPRLAHLGPDVARNSEKE
ncbi:hypothetical protein B0T13DRAFT_491977 [Neurospora crassa]|nr:hypothetical protein B0T13DRAFT_491977 [Neurospora crassa]